MTRMDGDCKSMAFAPFSPLLFRLAMRQQGDRQALARGGRVSV